MTQTTAPATTPAHHTRRPRTPMTPVIKTMRLTFVGGPGGRTRKECWSAISTDGVWAYDRLEDVGTYWCIQHRPSRYCGQTLYRSLDAARAATHSGAALETMQEECTETMRSPLAGIFKGDAEKFLASLPA